MTRRDGVLPARLVLALAVLTLLRLGLAAIIPLAPDEAYYWIWSRALAPGYLDHPPMVALWIRAGTALAGETALGVRLLGPLSVALGSWLLADAADRLLPGRNAGRVAAILLNATLLIGIGSVIMTPDTPLLFFWTLTLWALARIATGCSPGWWLVAGLAAGLAFASKYTAAFLWLGIPLWLLAVPALRHWLRRPQPWLGAGLGLAVVAPVVWWNAQHNWAGMLRQGGRVADWQPARAIGFLGELIGGQIGLATPLVFLLCAAGLLLAGREAWRRRDPAWTLLTALTLPPVLVFLQHAIGDRVQGNWPAILYPAGAVAAAGLTSAPWRRLVVPAVALGLGITAIVYAQAAGRVLPLPAGFDPISRQLAGWDRLASDLAPLRQQVGARFVVADQYALAAELAWHAPDGIPVIGSEPRWQLFDLPAAPMAGPGLLIRPARDGVPADQPDATPLALLRRPGIADRDGLFRVFKIGAVPATAVRLPQR